MRSVSSKDAMDKARRDLGSRSIVGGRKISPKDVLDRYSGDRAKMDTGSKDGKRPGSSSPGARPKAPGAGRGVKTTDVKPIGITDVRGGKSAQQPQKTGGPIKAGPIRTKSGKGRPITTRPDQGSKPGRPGPKGQDARPKAPGTKDGRPGSKARPNGFTNQLNTAVGAPRPGGGTDPRRPGTARPGATTHVGDPATGRWGGAWNCTYDNPYWYYDRCYWNTWGGLWCNNWWGPWCGAGFYFSGFWWNSYWCNGGTWWPSSSIGFGYRRPWRSRFANLYFFGPFLGASDTFVVYEEEEEEESPEVIIVEVPEGSDVTVVDGEVDVIAAPRPSPATVPLAPAAVELAPEATEPSLQRELNRASAYYLTQGDRAFRESRFGDAAHFYAKAVEFEPGSGILYLVLSDALFATGDYRYAAHALRQAFDNEPDLAANVVDKRDFYAEPATFEEQIRTLEEFVKDHALDMDARLVLATNYLFGGRPAEALSLLENPFSQELATSDEGRLLKATALRVLVARESTQR
ncbi:MAG: hypothetical protein VX460_11465 [Planctomycetota bacterium]|nr:hypothetical protein [Planctomycetota bacterium]